MINIKKFKLNSTSTNVKPDPAFISKIQPEGNLIFSQRYIQTGCGFTSCVQIFAYPSQAFEFWLNNITNLYDVIVVMDIATQNKNMAKEDMSRSLTELNSRYMHANESVSRIEAEHDYSLLNDLLTQVTSTGEVIKTLMARIYVSGNTREEVEKHTADIINDLDSKNYQGSLFLNETSFQYKSIFMPYSSQLLMPNKRKGAPLSSVALAGGYPFNYENLNDDCGQYFGQTYTGGNVLFDLFHKSKQRLSYDALLIGQKGSGKSTTLKKLMKANAIIGNYTRIIDPMGEFTTLTKALGGKVIRLDGQHSKLNYLEVFKTAESEQTSFSKHLSKLNIFYKFYSPESTDAERNEFEEYARKLYVKCGLWKETNIQDNQITGLPSDRYPIFSDLLSLVQSDLYEDIKTNKINRNFSENKLKHLENIELNLKSIINSYGTLFNGYTTLPNLLNEKTITYNIENITSMKSEVFSSQLYNILTLIINDMFTIGSKSKKLYENGEKIPNVKKLLLIIDEAHQIISTKNMLVLDNMIKITREDRKFFTGLVFASQSIRDYAPENSDSEGIDKLKTLFELTQYKFIMQQDSNTLNLMRNVFEGELTESQLIQIPRFEQGQCILSLGNSRTLNMKIEITKEEEKLFEGGA